VAKGEQLFWIKFNTKYGLDMAQAVSRRPYTVEARFCCQFIPCGTCGAQSDTGTDFCEYFRAVPGRIFPSALRNDLSASDTCNLSSKSSGTDSGTSDRIFSAHVQVGAFTFSPERLQLPRASCPTAVRCCALPSVSFRACIYSSYGVRE
jgi:hypothetical protein